MINFSTEGGGTDRVKTRLKPPAGTGRAAWSEPPGARPARAEDMHATGAARPSDSRNSRAPLPSPCRSGPRFNLQTYFRVAVSQWHITLSEGHRVSVSSKSTFSGGGPSLGERRSLEVYSRHLK